MLFGPFFLRPHTTLHDSSSTSLAVSARFFFFFPVYNDEASIAGIVTLALAQLPQPTTAYNVIVVNVGSRAGTAAVLVDRH